MTDLHITQLHIHITNAEGSHRCTIAKHKPVSSRYKDEIFTSYLKTS